MLCASIKKEVGSRDRPRNLLGKRQLYVPQYHPPFTGGCELEFVIVDGDEREVVYHPP